MNCRSAQRLLSAERDGAPASGRHADLVAHLAECADCRRFQAIASEAAQAWRTTTEQVQAPDAELAWQAVRRKIRAGDASVADRSAPWFSRWAIPAGAVALLAVVAVIVAPRWRADPVAATAMAPRENAQTGFVEVPGASTSSMVFVDDKSGWLVVWAVDDAKPKSG